MLKIDHTGRKVNRIAAVPLAQALRQFDLCAAIHEAPEAFFNEMNQDLFLLVARPASANDSNAHSIHMALDRQGAVVLVVTQREVGVAAIDRAMYFRSKVEAWRPEHILNKLSPEKRDELRSFLDVELNEINSVQRMLLLGLSIDFDASATATALNASTDLVVCMECQLFRDPSNGSQFLVCAQPELSSGFVFDAPADSTMDTGARDATSEAVTEQALVLHPLAQVAVGPELTSAPEPTFEPGAVALADYIEVHPRDADRVVIDGWLVHEGAGRSSFAQGVH